MFRVLLVRFAELLGNFYRDSTTLNRETPLSAREMIDRSADDMFSPCLYLTFFGRNTPMGGPMYQGICGSLIYHWNISWTVLMY